MYHYKRKKRNTYGITLLSLIATTNIILFPKHISKPIGTNVAYANFLNNSSSSQNDGSEVDFSNDLFIDDNLNQLYYVVQPGDSLASIAKSFGLTNDQLKKTNNLDSNEVSVGQRLLIIHDQGFIITLDRDINIDEFAAKYGLDPQELRSVNYVGDTTSIVENGSEFFIPLSTEEAIKRGIIDKPEEAQVQEAASVEEIKQQTQTSSTSTLSKPTKTTSTSSKASTSTTTVSNSIRPVSNKGYNSNIRNGFVVGQCTWYVAVKKFPYLSSTQQSRPWGGNGGQWYRNAAAAGYKVGKTPQVGAIIVLNYGNYYGHVGIVKAIDGDKVLVESMNYKGPFIVSTNRESARGGATVGYIYY